MAITIVIFSLAALCFCFIPVKIALHLYIDGKIRFSSGAAVIKAKFADRRAAKKARSPKKKPGLFESWISNASGRRKSGTLFTSLKHFFRHAHIDEFTAEGSISLSDAANTALLCGAANALSAALTAYPRVSIRIKADFSSGRSNVLVRGMLSMRAGHIILAAIWGIAHYIKGGIAQWKNIRLRTS